MKPMIAKEIIDKEGNIHWIYYAKDPSDNPSIKLLLDTIGKTKF